LETRNLGIEIGEEKIKVKLLWEDSPNICQILWDNLPFESSATMAKICNHEFMIQLPFNAPFENSQLPVPGSVGFWPIRQCVNIWFDDPGPTGPLGFTALFGQIVDNRDGLSSVAAKTWIKPGTRVKFYKITK